MIALIKNIRNRKAHWFAIVFSFISLMTFSHCSQLEIPPDSTDDPVFTLTMTTETNDIMSFGGGIDGYRMFTSYEQESDGVYTFIGELKKEDLNLDTFPSVRFEVRDFQGFPSSVDIDQALIAAEAYFNQNLTGSSDTTYQAVFMATTGQACSNLPSNAFSWDFGDTFTGTGHAISHDYTDNSYKTVTLEINGPAGQYAMASRDISFAQNALTCGVQVNYNLTNSLNISAMAIGGIQPYSYTWNIGSTLQTISLPLDSIILDQEYCVTLTDASSCSSSWCGNVLSGYQVCEAQFSYSTSIVTDSVPAPDQFSTVTIIYKDGAGGEFRSDLGTQNPNAFFDILNVDDFIDNEFGDKTKKINIDFTCELFSGNANTIRINSGEGFIGIAYPD